MRTYTVKYRLAESSKMTGHQKIRAHGRQHAIYKVYLSNRENISTGKLDYFKLGEQGRPQTIATVLFKKPDLEPRYQEESFWKGIEDLVKKMDNKETNWTWWTDAQGYYKSLGL